MRAHEELYVKPLFQWLQPVTNEAGTCICFACCKRLNKGLAAGTLVEQVNVEIVLGVEALGHAKA